MTYLMSQEPSHFQTNQNNDWFSRCLGEDGGAGGVRDVLDRIEELEDSEMKS